MWMLAAVPVIVAALAGTGALWATPLSRLHSTVALAEQVRLEELGQAKETTDASDAYRNTGQPLDRLYQDARAAATIRADWHLAGSLGGSGLECQDGVTVSATPQDRLSSPTDGMRVVRTLFQVVPGRIGASGADSGRLGNGQGDVRMSRFVTHRSLIWTAWVAGVFSLIIGILMTLDFADRGKFELFDSPQYLELRQQLQSQPGNAELQQAMRDLDLQLRESYFRNRQFLAQGMYMLLGGVIVALVAARWAAALREHPPHPRPVDPDYDAEAVQQRYGKWAAAATVACLAIGLGAAALQSDSVLPEETSATKVAAVTGDEPDWGRGQATRSVRFTTTPKPTHNQKLGPSPNRNRSPRRPTVQRNRNQIQSRTEPRSAPRAAGECRFAASRRHAIARSLPEPVAEFPRSGGVRRVAIRRHPSAMERPGEHGSRVENGRAVAGSQFAHRVGESSDGLRRDGGRTGDIRFRRGHRGTRVAARSAPHQTGVGRVGSDGGDDPRGPHDGDRRCPGLCHFCHRRCGGRHARWQRSLAQEPGDAQERLWPCQLAGHVSGSADRADGPGA